MIRIRNISSSRGGVTVNGSVIPFGSEAKVSQLTDEIFELFKAKDIMVDIAGSDLDVYSGTAEQRIIYVRPDGNDSNNGTADDSAHAFLTIDRAIQEATLCYPTKLAKHPKIKLADGTYNEGLYIMGQSVLAYGSGYSIAIEGNTSSPQNVVINGPIECFRSCYNFRGFTCKSIYAFTGAWVSMLNVRVEHHVMSAHEAQLFLANVTFFGSTCNYGPYSRAPIMADHGSFIQVNSGCSVTSMTGGALASSDFARIEFNATLSGSFTGKRYDVNYNGAISTPGGSGGANYLPGTIAGTASNGGVYA